jgi:transcription elongation factor Elf1
MSEKSIVRFTIQCPKCKSSASSMRLLRVEPPMRKVLVCDSCNHSDYDSSFIVNLGETESIN